MSNLSIYQSPFNKQRKDKFIMVFDLPKILKPIKSKLERDNLKFPPYESVLPESVQCSIYGAVIPSLNIPSQNASYGGQTVKLTSYTRPPFENMTVNFTIDNMFNNYWVIYKWLNSFNDGKTGLFNAPIVSDGFMDEYQTTITIYGRDEYNKNVVKFNFFHCFPVSLGGISYSDRDSGEMESSFQYAYHQFNAELLPEV
jgi:hypothetical protein